MHFVKSTWLHLAKIRSFSRLQEHAKWRIQSCGCVWAFWLENDRNCMESALRASPGRPHFVGPMKLLNPTRATSHIGPKSVKQRSAWFLNEAESKLLQSSRRLAWRTIQDLGHDLVNRFNKYADFILSEVPKCDTLRLPQHDHSLVSNPTRQALSPVPAPGKAIFCHLRHQEELQHGKIAKRLQWFTKSSWNHTALSHNGCPKIAMLTGKRCVCVSQSINQSIYLSFFLFFFLSIFLCMDVRMDVCMYAWMFVCVDGCMYVCIAI